MNSKIHHPSSEVLDVLLSDLGGCAVLDGGLATELENRGVDLKDPLWSAKCLFDQKLCELVRQVHLDYFRAGAHVCISASYQATLPGFSAQGFTLEEAESFLKKSVQLVCSAREQYWKEEALPEVGKSIDQNSEPDSETNSVRTRPTISKHHRKLVAASVGSYGAYLADGSEFSGNYASSLSMEYLMDFHRRRLQLFGNSEADLIAVETLPSRLEAEAIVQVLEEENFPIRSWMSFNSLDGVHLADGSSFRDCVQSIAKSRHVAAIGINCTSPRFIQGLISLARQVTDKPIIVYPNSGEAWDDVKREWIEVGKGDAFDFPTFAPIWKVAGANLIGGCCRTTPDTIRMIWDALYNT